MRGRLFFFPTLYVRKTGRGKQGEKCHTDHPERPQRDRNRVLPNRLVNNVPWKADREGVTKAVRERGAGEEYKEKLGCNPLICYFWEKLSI